jgi:hypothetical protein
VAKRLSVSAEGMDGHLPADDGEALSLVAGALYDAAIDPAGWQPALTLASCYLGGFASMIYDWSPGRDSRGFIYDDGKLEPEFKARYFQHYASIDPVGVEQRSVPLGEPFSIADVIDIERFRRTRFHREWSQPQGIVDMLAAPIERHGSAAILFGVIRGHADGMVDEPMRRRMRLVAPHVRRALVIGGLQSESAERAGEFGAALDGLSSGLFMLDAGGRVLHANSAGQQMAAERAAIFVTDRGLGSPDLAATKALQLAVAAAASGAALIGGAGLDVAIVGRDGHRFAAHVLPLNARSGSLPGGAVVAVFVHPATLHTPAAPELLGQAYGLTPAEQCAGPHRRSRQRGRGRRAPAAVAGNSQNPFAAHLFKDRNSPANRACPP